MFLPGIMAWRHATPEPLFAIQVVLAIANVNHFLCDFFVLASIWLICEKSADMQATFL